MAVLLAAASSSHAQQTSVGVILPVYSDKSFSGNGTAGAFAQNVTTFNVIPTSGQYPGDAADGSTTLTLSASSLKDSTSATTNVGFSLQYTGTYETESPADGGHQMNSNNDKLLGSTYFDRKGSQATPAQTALTLTVTGLNTADTYNLYVYVESARFSGGDSATISDGAQSYSFSTNGTLTSLVQFTGNNATGNYALFTGLSGSSTTATIPGDTVAGVTGFQLVDLGAASVPEPATAWSAFGLLLLGGGEWVRRRGPHKRAAAV